METWYLLTLFGAFLYACAILLDKINFKNFVKDPLALVPVTAVVYIIGILVASPFFGGIVVPSTPLVIAFFAGIFNLIGFVLYFKAIYEEESTNISAILRLIPVFVLLFGFAFLGEIFSAPQYLGAVFLVIGAVGVSVKRFRHLLKPTRGIVFGIASALIYAIWTIITKTLIDEAGFFQVFLYGTIGFALASLAYAALRKDGYAIFKTNLRTALKIACVASVLNLVGEGAGFAALETGTASLFAALGSTVPLFSLILILGLGKHAFTFTGERISGEILLRKLFFILMIILGAWLLA